MLITAVYMRAADCQFLKRWVRSVDSHSRDNYSGIFQRSALIQVYDPYKLGRSGSRRNVPISSFDSIVNPSCFASQKNNSRLTGS